MELFYSSDIQGNTLFLDKEESAHCVKVLRHRAGDAVSVIDGCGTLYRCTLLSADAKAVEARIDAAEENFGTHSYKLHMAVCPTKNIARYEWFVEKATEVGVDSIVPVFGDHSERRNINAERISRIMLSAAKQSLKAAVPRLAEPLPVKEWLRKAPESSLRLIAYCDESLDRDLRLGLDSALGNLPPDAEICVLIGQEGDFSPEEVSLALELGWNPVHLGDSRLRTETAALAAVFAVYFALSRR